MRTCPSPSARPALPWPVFRTATSPCTRLAVLAPDPRLQGTNTARPRPCVLLGEVGRPGGGMSARLSSMSGRILSTVHRPDYPQEEACHASPWVLLAVPYCAGEPPPGDGGERRRGNKKGTNPGPPDRTRRTRRTTIVLRTPPPVLNSTAANSGPPFGTKRPQVQILSPRPCFRRPEALTRVGEGLSCCQYRNEIPQVPQQIRTFDLLLKWVPPAGVALR
jgi:hypothetical protein